MLGTFGSVFAFFPAIFFGLLIVFVLLSETSSVATSTMVFAAAETIRSARTIFDGASRATYEEKKNANCANIFASSSCRAIVTVH